MQRVNSWEELKFLVQSAGVPVEQALGFQDDTSQGEHTLIPRPLLCLCHLYTNKTGEQGNEASAGVSNYKLQ